MHVRLPSRPPILTGMCAPLIVLALAGCDAGAQAGPAAPQVQQRPADVPVQVTATLPALPASPSPQAGPRVVVVPTAMPSPTASPHPLSIAERAPETTPAAI